MKKLLFFAWMGINTLAWGQTKLDLNPITITSNRLEEKINESGRNITLIKGEQFQQLPVQSLEELLKYVPGVEVQSRGPMGAQSDIILRGGTFQQVLILLDGIKINDPITGHFNSYMPIAPYEIERIEILRGPAAAVYGAEAVGGVIHIISKTFSRAADTAKGAHGQIKIAGGAYNMLHSDAGLRYSSKKVQVGMGVLSNNTTGQLLRGNNRGYLYNNTLSASASIQLTKNWRISLRSAYDSRNFAAQNFYTTFSSDTATEKVTTYWNQAQLIQNKKNGNQEIDVVYKMTADNYQYNPIATANENRSAFTLIQYINNRQINNKWHISFGGQSSQRAIISNDRGNHNTNQLAAFGTALYHFKQWHLSGSLRGDWDENYGFAILPQANTSFALHKMNIRASVGKAIRNADFTERYNNYNKASVSGGSIGNPDLGAENSWNYELGVSTHLNKEWSINATLFYRQQNNVIDWVNTPYADMPRQFNLLPTGSYALAKNIKQVDTKGAELDITYQKQLGQEHQLFLNSGISLLNSKSNDSAPSYYIIAHAKTLIQGTAVYQYKKLQLSLNILYKQRNISEAKGINASITPNYCLLNARIGFSFQNHWSIFVQSNNITDIQYSDLLGSPMPRRWLSGGASFVF
ncbi:MAG: TonB-dependent receptor [Phycisphaerales bacterium]|nr:TonB-dependent receptor [Phycisphaerales bacterium]